MRTWNRILIPAFAVIAAACGAGPADQEFVDAAPNFESMSMDITGDADQEGLNSASGVVEQNLSGTDLGLVMHARWAARLTNKHIGRVLKLVNHLLKAPPTEITEDTHVWLRQGPDKKVEVEVKLTVTKDSDTHFTYTLEVRKTGENDASFVKVAEGDLTKGAVKGERSGTITVHYEKLAGKDGNVKASGDLQITFSVADGQKDVIATWTRFKDDLEGTSKDITGKYHFRKFIHTGNAAMRFARDVTTSFLGADYESQFRVIARWKVEVGGVARAKLVISAPSREKTWKSIECWNRSLDLRYRLVVKDDGTTESSRTVGDISACPPAADVPEPSENDADSDEPLNWPTM